ncbi:hypothetical protein TVAG_170350 [Trichomonas vaginalis G3]|uniref:Uncharacterized protein n=1 Tax=Trichomonas vaginalis (strain ATCC PRA-98 / G3) TaxID=412133 RepID=A2DPH7_TRIV3|nr:RNA polymerase II transcription regulator recruiting protein [Trichomonas vaginalis G3]EAY17721.1 hypothetical protein TVAG_170350 [Trichomonas vaginalis G3]KAI5507875.1 RNA polymerase II transcription regulator recruiting protein [Trichomonas vaginalis G3]|eukprot:XP_001329856.1 hypothetical protein [Trichomonas vaginalis G3]
MTRSFLGQQCILEYFASQLQDLNPDISDAVFEELKNTLLLFIKDAKSYNECLSIFTEKLGSTSPLDMLKTVIDTDVTSRTEIETSSSDSSSDTSNTVSQSGRKRARPWNSEEDKRLLAGILRNGTDN